MTAWSTWDDDMIAKLRELWGEGHSTSEIGRRLGVSKNSCVGKAHRLDLPERPSPIKRGPPKLLPPDRAGRIALPPLEGSTLPPLASSIGPDPLSPTVESSAPSAWLAWCDQLPHNVFNAIRRAPHKADCPVSRQRMSLRLWECTCETSQPGCAAAAVPVKRQVVSKLVAKAIVRAAALASDIIVEPTIFKPRRREPCCWPIGQGKSITFCDELAEVGKSYCTAHGAKAHLRIRPRADDATISLGAD